MENKINIAELLKDCPQGMELYSPLCGKCVFDRLNMGTIICKKQNTQEITFTSEGYYMLPVFNDCECMIFPSKDQRDWSKFQRPFKDGDIVATQNGIWIGIHKRMVGNAHEVYLAINHDCLIYNDNIFCFDRLATKKEKEKLFEAIKANGYKWNPETKTLEKLIKFNDGDILATDLGSVFFLNTRLNTDECYGCYVGKGGDGSFHICEPFAYKECCGLATKKEKEKLFEAIKANGYKWNPETKTLEKLPKFKAGDRIRHKTTNKDDVYEISEVYDDSYGLVGFTWMIYMEYQDQYELVPNKFDITTLKPFESRVLMRDKNTEKWVAQFFSHYNNGSDRPYTCIGCEGLNEYIQCIPYEGNEHLLDTTNDCDDFYKTWE